MKLLVIPNMDFFLAKLSYEETLLAQRFPEYAAYQQRTRKLLPFVY